MNAVLYLNNSYYRTIEVPDYQPVIYWAMSNTSAKVRYCQYHLSVRDTIDIIEFHYCGCGIYHCHTMKPSIPL